MVFQIGSGASALIRFGLGMWFASFAMAFDMSLNTNLAVYWGQNSIGSTDAGNAADWQQPIEFYCGDDTIDTIPVAFLTEFYSTGNLPSINLANTCSTTGNPAFPGTNLPNCSFLASGIETCQNAGKIVTLSMGGATGSPGFSSDSAGAAYAQVIWDLFLGGQSATRPFGPAVLDGVDMDIEGGSQTGLVSFLNALRTLMNGGNKKYYITGAPQCPFPDAFIGDTLNGFGFDAVYVQFYNNYCEVSNFASGTDFDFSTWDNWAKTVSPNKDVKVYIGAPASSSAAGSGFVSASTLSTIISQVQGQYSSFGGVMLWDASQAYANGRYDKAAKAALTASGGSSPPPPSSSSSSSSPSPSSAPSSSPSASTPSSSPSASTPSSSPSASAPSHSSSSSGRATSTPPGKPTTTAKTVPTTTGTGTGVRAVVGPTSTSATPSSTPSTSSGDCAGVAPWSADAIYLECDEVTYGGLLWEALWWTEGSTPGGAAYDGWSMVGSC